MFDDREVKSDGFTDDLLWGGPAIAQYVALSLHKTYRAISLKRLPTRRVGGKLVALKSKLRAAILQPHK